MQITKPMLAVKIEDTSKLVYPLLGTPKLDGIRAFMRDGHLVSRTGKPIKNNHIRTLLESFLPDGVDGELMTSGSFQDITSAVMRADGEPDFKYCIFDLCNDPEAIYLQRIAKYVQMIADLKQPMLFSVMPAYLTSEDEMLQYESDMLELGYEGIIVRSPDGLYKQGRSTLKEQGMMKLKRFEDAEAVITGFIEQMHNANAATKNEVGHTKRSSAKGGLVPCDTLGTFKVRDIESGVDFEIGTGKGLTLALRKEIWQNQDKFLGKIVRYTHFAIGRLNLPRLPSFQGFRDADAM